jgi:hypothetical protein
MLPKTRPEKGKAGPAVFQSASNAGAAVKKLDWRREQYHFDLERIRKWRDEIIYTQLDPRYPWLAITWYFVN